MFSLQAFSHAERLRNRAAELLDYDRIQKVLCSGSDIFDYMPEAYSFKDLAHRFGTIPKQLSSVHLPRHLVEQVHRFKFLLPGGCMRQK